MAPPVTDSVPNFDLIIKHGHQDLVQAVAFNSYGDRCATGSVDGKIRVFNRHRDGVWRHCDNWTAHGGEILELQWLPPTIYPNLLASLGVEGRFKLWAEDPSAAPGRRFSSGGGVSNISGGTGNINASTAATSTASNARSNVAGAATTTATGPGTTTTTTTVVPTPPPLPPPSSSSARDANPKAAFETRSSRSPYRSFSMRHVDDTRHTYLALVSADGRMTVYENEQAENLSDWARIDEVSVLHRAPARGDETAFRVRFDPNPDPCYAALRAGVPTDALGLVVAAMQTVRVYRSRDVITSALGGIAQSTRQLYLAAELSGHRGLVRDVAWAPGNIRGYDIIATACRDGFVRVFSLTTPYDGIGDAGGWSSAQILQRHAHDIKGLVPLASSTAPASGTATPEQQSQPSQLSQQQSQLHTLQQQSHHHQQHHQDDQYQTHPRSGIRAGLDQSKASATDRGDRSGGGMQQGVVRHTAAEISRLDHHRTPVWRVGFDDDGQVLGSVGDEGRLLCYRQMPDGAWAKSSELAMMKMRMAVP